MSKRTRAASSASTGRTDWQNVADWYDRLVGEQGSEFHQKIVLPGVLRLLDPQAGQRAIDIACGQGVLCRLLAEHGLDVVGVDAARSLIGAARERQSDRSASSPSPSTPGEGRGGDNSRDSTSPGLKPGCVASRLSNSSSASSVQRSALNSSPHPYPPPEYQGRGSKQIEYHVGDARDLSFLPDQSFDLAACVLAIQNIHPILPVFEHASRLLRAGGRMVVVMMHPSFRISGQSAWGWDEEKKIQYRRVDGYLLPRKTPIVTHPGSQPDVYTWTFHKPLESYVKAIARAGLMIDALEEWASHKTSTSGPRAAAENLARKEFPMFLAIRAVKPKL